MTNLSELIDARLRARFGDYMRPDEATAFRRELFTAIGRRLAKMPLDGRSLLERWDAATIAELTQ